MESFCTIHLAYSEAIDYLCALSNFRTVLLLFVLDKLNTI